MKISIALIIFLASFLGFAQPVSTELEAMIRAERSFANMSREGSTRQAFLKFLSDSTVMFAGGDVVNGKNYYTKKKETEDLLFWWPEFAGIAQSGDFGFSTGPYQWSPNKQAAPVGFGSYATVWEKSSDGSWHMAIDLGVSHEPITPSSKEVYAVSNPVVALTSGKTYSVMEASKQFDREFKPEQKKLLKTYYCEDARLLRESKLPLSLSDIDVEVHAFEFNTLGGKVAKSKDMAYTYGLAKSKNADGTETKHYFMRVWKRAQDAQWKIVLDVVGNFG